MHYGTGDFESDAKTLFIRRGHYLILFRKYLIVRLLHMQFPDQIIYMMQRGLHESPNCIKCQPNCITNTCVECKTWTIEPNFLSQLFSYDILFFRFFPENRSFVIYCRNVFIHNSCQYESCYWPCLEIGSETSAPPPLPFITENWPGTCVPRCTEKHIAKLIPFSWKRPGKLSKIFLLSPRGYKLLFFKSII